MGSFMGNPYDQMGAMAGQHGGPGNAAMFNQQTAPAQVQQSINQWGQMGQGLNGILQALAYYHMAHKPGQQATGAQAPATPVADAGREMGYQQTPQVGFGKGWAGPSSQMPQMTNNGPMAQGGMTLDPRGGMFPYRSEVPPMETMNPQANGRPVMDQGEMLRQLLMRIHSGVGMHPQGSFDTGRPY